VPESRTVEVAAARLSRWVAGFAERHGPVVATSDGSGLELVAADGAIAVLSHPWGEPDAAGGSGPTDPTSAVAALAAWVGAPRRVAVLLVRRGGYACAVVDDGRVVASKVGTRHVQGRTAAGGWSQQRYARRRAKQTDELAGAAADLAARLLLRPPAAWLATGGDRPLVERVLADPRLTRLAQLPRSAHLAVGDPGARLVSGLPRLLTTVTVTLIEPAGRSPRRGRPPGTDPDVPLDSPLMSRSVAAPSAPGLPPVVDRSWVSDHAGDAVLADVRWYLGARSGRSAYQAGHLPGAVFVDLDTDLAGPRPPGPSRVGRHPLPSPQAFAASMARLGIGDDDVVVGYDDEGGVIAARLVWMLRATGHRAALLDGGIRPDDTLTTEVPSRPHATFTPRPWPSGRLAGLDDATDRANLVLDARHRDRYRGEVEPVDPRPGHVPGARSLPARSNLAGDGRILPVPELRRRFAAVGLDDPGATSSVISMCGSGVTACHTLLLLEHAGLGEGRLFPGSWSAYSSDPSLPAALGDAPG